MKNIPRVLIIIFSLHFCDQQVYAQDRDNTYIISVCDSIMKGFVDGNYPKALQILKRNSLIENYKIDTLAVTVPQVMSDIIPSYGKVVSYKFVLQQESGDVIKKRYYILMLEKYLLKFDFTWYKASKGWAIINFNFDENLTDVLR